MLKKFSMTGIFLTFRDLMQIIAGRISEKTERGKACGARHKSPHRAS